MTLLTIAKEVLQDIGLEVPSTIFGNSNETAVRILQAINRSGRDIVRKGDWTVLENEHTFSTVASTASDTGAMTGGSTIVAASELVPC